MNTITSILYTFVHFLIKTGELVIKTVKQILLLVTFSAFLISWGGIGHSIISKKSAESFPAEMLGFDVWADSLRINASNADYRKSNDWSESPKHYIDIDNYSEFISNGRIAGTYDSIVNLHGVNFVIDNGTLPWATLNTYDSLVVAFQKGKWHKAMLFASDLGHYVADGHMPLHITANYDGGLTGQNGIHSRYETSMVFNNQTALNNYSVPKAAFVADVNKYVFDYIYKNYPYVDSVLQADSYATSIAGNNTTEYYSALWEKAKFTTTLFRNASKSLGELIYTAWVQAGKPAFGSVVNSEIPLNDNTELLAYPNPTKGNLKIAGNNILKVEVRNISGMLVANFTNTEINIDVLPNGMYLLSVYDKQGVLKKQRILLAK